MMVTELARCTNTSPDTVRYYVRIGLLNPRRHPANGYKLFSSGDSKRVRFIRRAKALGYSLAEIELILKHSAHGHSPCPLVREIIQRRIEENKHKLNELNALQHRMETALQRWRDMPDGVPDGDSICHLIESFDLEAA
ncbi:MAG: MerR family DNA-binding protein [Mariprofundaceae bacterium]